MLLCCSFGMMESISQHHRLCWAVKNLSRWCLCFCLEWFWRPEIKCEVICGSLVVTNHCFSPLVGKDIYFVTVACLVQTCPKVFVTHYFSCLVSFVVNCIVELKSHENDFLIGMNVQGVWGHASHLEVDSGMYTACILISHCKIVFTGPKKGNISSRSTICFIWNISRHLFFPRIRWKTCILWF